MIKRVEVNYRGIFQKNLGKKIGSDIVMIASRMGQRAFSNGRYSDSPERNGIPCKYFAFVSPDLAEEELEAECGAKLEIDEANISVVLDDTNAVQHTAARVGPRRFGKAYAQCAGWPSVTPSR